MQVRLHGRQAGLQRPRQRPRAPSSGARREQCSPLTETAAHASSSTAQHRRDAMLGVCLGVAWLWCGLGSCYVLPGDDLLGPGRCRLLSKAWVTDVVYWCTLLMRGVWCGAEGRGACIRVARGPGRRVRGGSSQRTPGSQPGHIKKFTIMRDEWRAEDRKRSASTLKAFSKQ